MALFGFTFPLCVVICVIKCGSKFDKIYKWLRGLYIKVIKHFSCETFGWVQSKPNCNFWWKVFMSNGTQKHFLYILTKRGKCKSQNYSNGLRTMMD